jgi:hypothetical protein
VIPVLHFANKRAGNNMQTGKGKAREQKLPREARPDQPSVYKETAKREQDLTSPPFTTTPPLPRLQQMLSVVDKTTSPQGRCSQLCWQE